MDRQIGLVTNAPGGSEQGNEKMRITGSVREAAVTLLAGAAKHDRDFVAAIRRITNELEDKSPERSRTLIDEALGPG
jgi:hypothetical protein